MTSTGREARTPRPEMQRSTSKTFLSNDVMYGDRTQPAANHFVTEAKLMQQRAANESVKMDDQPARYAKGLKPRAPTMSGILNDQNKETIVPQRPMDLETKREICQKRSQIRELSDSNRKMFSSKVRQETLENFQEKKSNARLAKYLTDKDRLAELALKNAKERQVRHLKRDEVAAKTLEL